MLTLSITPTKIGRLSLLVSACLSVNAWAVIPSPTEAYISYTVVKGDTLEALSKKLLIEPKRWNELAKLNQLKTPNLIQPGLVIDVPRSMLNFNAQPETALNGSLTSVSGEVLLNGQAVQAGAAVPQGTKLQATPGSSAVLKMADGSTVQLMPKTLIEVTRQGGYQLKDPTSSISTTWYSGVIRLFEGVLDIAADKTARRASPLGVMTPTSVVGVRGTTFRVAYDDPASQVARTEVLEGAVRSGNPQTQAKADVNGGFGTAFKPTDRDIKVVPLLPALPPEALPTSSLRDSQGTRSAPWNFAALSGAAGYKIDVARDAAFNQLVTQYKVSQPSADLTALANGSYHVRVRGFDNSGIEGYNAVRLVQISDAPPPPPAPVPPREVRWIHEIQRTATVDAQADGSLHLKVNLDAKQSPQKLQLVIAHDMAFSQGIQRIDLQTQAMGSGYLQFSTQLPAMQALQKRYLRFEGISPSGHAEQSGISILELPANWGNTVFSVLHALQPVQ